MNTKLTIKSVHAQWTPDQDEDHLQDEDLCCYKREEEHSPNPFRLTDDECHVYLADDEGTLSIPRQDGLDLGATLLHYLTNPTDNPAAGRGRWRVVKDRDTDGVPGVVLVYDLCDVISMSAFWAEVLAADYVEELEEVLGEKEVEGFKAVIGRAEYVRIAKAAMQHIKDHGLTTGDWKVKGKPSRNVGAYLDKMIEACVIGAIQEDIRRRISD